MKIIIFDFFRTLYDPDTDALVPGCTAVLQALHERGYLLYLISRAELGRGGLIERESLIPYFAEVKLVAEKTLGGFQELLDAPSVSRADSWVIGDYLKQEIKYGNQAGAKTIWIRSGKFSGLTPDIPLEEPLYTVEKISEILQIIK